MVDSKLMRIIFHPAAVVAGSFFPGLAKPVVIESETLAEDERRTLETLVEEANFFAQPDRISSFSVNQLRDAGEMTITIERADKRHTTMVVGPLTGPDQEPLRRLVKFLESKARELRARRPEAER